MIPIFLLSVIARVDDDTYLRKASFKEGSTPLHDASRKLSQINHDWRRKLTSQHDPSGYRRLHSTDALPTFTWAPNNLCEEAVDTCRYSTAYIGLCFWISFLPAHFFCT
jgi:hypothetical protein